MVNVPMVFVSSTKSDLQAERHAILSVLQRLSLPHNSMESFGANVQTPLRKCHNEVARCDIFIIIIAHRYGTIIPDEEVSYTENEYNVAVRNNKQVLAYIKDDQERVLVAHVESDDANAKKLRELKENICSKHTISYFGTPMDLAVQVAIDLSCAAERWPGTAQSNASLHSAVEPTTGNGYDEERSHSVKTSVRYGVPPRNLVEAVSNCNRHYNHDFIPEDEMIDESELKKAGVLFIPGSGYNRRRQFTSKEIDAIKAFVASGGGLLCAGAAWSWAYRQYGNMPVEQFPLNLLGEAIGFRISGTNIGDPDPGKTDRDVFGSVGEWQGVNKWAASQVEPTRCGVEKALCDTKGRALAVKGEFRLGKFVVLGHEGMLEFNPKIFCSILDYIRPLHTGGDNA